jgi:hypothetical protein
MRVKLIRTEGPWLMATIEDGDRQFCVMDVFTSDDSSAPKPGEEFDVELSVLMDEDGCWEALFSGNPGKKKGLEAISGWSYRAFGEIVRINPVLVDCGIISVEDVLHAIDQRVVGEFVAFTVSRLDATLHPTNVR